jgi:heparan-alpha-glucosaminide N-acetyltransferase
MDSTETPRIESIDIFRGITVLLMIFVDNLGFVNGLPWWTNHMPRDANGMTYVDMVFPAFLFLMGMSIPISMRSRTARGESKRTIWLHVVPRSMSLVALGLFISNAPQVDAQRAGISSAWWAAIGFVAVALTWHQYSSASGHKLLHQILKYAGLTALVLLAAIFRRTTADGHLAWLDFSDWEILGLLGWAYLLVSAAYLLFQKRIVLLTASFGALVAINALSTAGRLSWLNPLPPYLKPFEAGLSSITMAGLLASLLLLDDSVAATFKEKVRWGISSAAILFFAGWLLKPLGISKIRDTPTWCLYCIAANILIVLLLYWIADIKRMTRWAKFTKPVGSNALLSYFLPYVAYFSPKLERLTAEGTSGWHGVLKSLFFTSLILAIVAVLTRFRTKLRL